MPTLFLLGCAIGLMLLVMLPDPKEKWQRLATRGGAASLFAIGLFGSVFSLIAT